jgi:microcystin synthetase protein McyG
MRQNVRLPENVQELAPLKQAVLALKQVREELDELRLAHREPIAIVGMGCRFPGGGDNPAAYWQALRAGVDGIVEVPPDRWPIDAYYDPDPDAPGKMYTRHGGFIRDVDRFDAAFFRINPREASRIDPQQRLLLEVSWEALEDAGHAPDRLVRSDTGVFVGLMTTDYLRLLITSEALLRDPFAAMGNGTSFPAGRLSYTLGLQGPSLVVDTACSSSLVALHLACQSLRNDECRMALAGGVNLMLTPEMNVLLTKARVLASDGRCKTFDAAADGYSRGEGCGMVVLKRLSHAQADGDNVLALVRGSAVNHCGPSGGLTVPSGPAQEALIRRALREAGVKPADLAYVEAHGTGTALGDPIELRALGAVLREGRDPASPCLVGSVKTNLGHLEAAAGAASLIKTVLALRHGEIPAHLHFKQPSPHVPWAELPLRVADRLTPWPEGAPRLAGVSSFGLSGINAHVVLEAAAARAAVPPSSRTHLLTVSAREPRALAQGAARLARHLEADGLNLADVALTTALGRVHFQERLAVVAGSSRQAAEQLSAFGAGRPAPGLIRAEAASAQARVAFLFSGQGAQYAGMGLGLYETQPAFRAALDACDAHLRSLLEVALLDLFTSPDLAQTRYAQPALFALEYALAQLWRSFGVEPDALLGHSLGELAAACVAGALELSDGLRLAVERGRLMQTTAPGGMAAVMADEPTVAAALAPWADAVAIAAVNAPAQTVISGEPAAVAAAAEALRASGIETHMLEATRAFHSRLMDPVLEVFERGASVAPRPPKRPLVSNLDGRLVSHPLDAAHWRRHLRAPVRFADGMRTLLAEGVNTFVEVGPRSTLLALGRACAGEEAAARCAWLPSLAAHDDGTHVLRSLATLYVRGAPVDWEGVHRGSGARRVSLPTYAFQRERHWIEGIAVAAPAATANPVAHRLCTLAFHPAAPAPPGTTVLTPPGKIAARLDRRLAELKDELGLGFYRELVPRLEAVSVAYVRRLLGDQPPSAEGQGVTPTYRRLHGRLLEIAAGGDALGVPIPPDPDAACAALVARWPASRAEIELLARCGRHLGEVLRGAMDPVELLFSKTGEATLDEFYAGSPAYRGLNALVRESVAEALAGWPTGRPLRVLEIGAGTGSTTEYLLPLLPTSDVEYVFTDVSRLFVSSAAERFGAYPYVRYEVLDIERDPATQGFGGGTFDLVVAANVLHATRDLRQTLRHVGGLLAPEGLFVLVEGVQPQGWLDVMFGLLPGWWNFTDLALRPAHPLVGTATWRALLAELGCAEVSAVPDGDESFQQAVILARGPRREAEGGLFVVLADRGGVGSALAGALRAAGRDFVELAAGTDGRDLADLLRRQPCHGVIDLRALDASDPAPAALLPDAVTAECLRPVRVVQETVRAELPVPPRLWLATRQAQRVGDEPGPVSLAGTALWGLGRVIAREHPELWGGLIDLDRAAEPPAVAALIRDEVLAARDHRTGDDQVAFRDGTRHVARIVAVGGDPARRVSVSAEASYVITGGWGGLGLVVARWLVGRGARHLVLVGRSEPSKEGRDAVEQMRSAGADVELARLDVADEAAVAGLVERLRAGGAPLRGVVHAAGVLEDATIASLDPARLARVLAPKVAGAYALHLATRNLRLDFFALFSSAVSLVGQAGSAAYAAGNAFLDGLAHHRRDLGLAGVSINWGEWTGVGMAREVSARREARHVPLSPWRLSTDDGLAGLDLALAGASAQVTLMPSDWATLRQRLGTVPLLAELGTPAPAPPEEGSAFHERLMDAPPAERGLLIARHLRQVVGGILGASAAELPDDANIIELGMDSLMVMEALRQLKRDLALTLYPRELYERPRLGALAEYLLAEFERARALRPRPTTQAAALSVELEVAPTAEPLGPRNSEAAFLLSAPRSGSTLLRVMLAGHPGLFSPPELHLLPYRTMGDRRKKLGLTYFGEGLQRAFMELRDGDPDAARAFLDGLEAEDVPVQEAYRRLQEEAAPRRLVDKTPAYAGSLETLRRAETMFTGARYVHLVRHPVAMIESFVRMRLDRLVGAGDVDPYLLGEEVWLRSNRNVEALFAEVDPGRRLLLRYEDLVAEPEASMRRVCDFLGVEYCEAVLHPYQGERMRDGVRAGSAPINDPNFLNHDRINPALGEAWRTIRLPVTLSPATRELAARLGYALTAPASAPEPLREETATVRGTKLAVCAWGPTEGPTVLCVHGLLEQGAVWDLVAQRLVEHGYRVLAPDLRGHGRSAHATTYHLTDFLADVDGVVRALTDGTVVLVGHSMGAAVCALFASARAPRVRALVLVEPPVDVHREGAGALEQYLDYVASPPPHPILDGVEAAAERLRRATPSLDPGRARRLAERIVEPCAGGLRWRWDPLLRTRAGFAGDAIALGNGGYARLAEAFAAPLTVVYGRDSALLRPEHAESHRMLLPHARSVVLPGGHGLHHDAPGPLAGLIAEALTAGPKGASA